MNSMYLHWNMIILVVGYDCVLSTELCHWSLSGDRNVIMSHKSVLFRSMSVCVRVWSQLGVVALKPYGM